MEYSGPSEFVHLHNHTLFSMLDGVQSPEELASAVAEREWPAFAVTEHGHMSSVPDCYFAARDKNVKYICGAEIYYNDYELARQKLVGDGEKLSGIKQSNPDLHTRIMRNRHLTVISKNMTGFHNLVRLTTEAWKLGYYYKPRIWFDRLVEHKDGLIVLSGCLNGPISYELRNKNIKAAIGYVVRFKELFGEDFYIEVQMPCLQDVPDYWVFWALVKLAKKFNIKLALSNDSHYIDRRDFEIQKLMMAIDQGLTVNSPDLFHVNSDEQYLKTRAELYTTFKTKKYCENVSDSDFEDMCNNTIEIASKCDPFVPNLDPKIPTGEGDVEKLRRAVADALIERKLHKCTKKYIIDNKEVSYLDQVKIELNRFIEKGFASYFLITQNLIKFNHDNGLPVGPRGSLGGSLVCYLLGIHELDPLKWGLSFDRFLSPSRGGYMLKIKAE